ncbi:MAG TPA: methyltransferase domain-containing protein [Candidatus Dormibacteraeota bacterium]|nr:methyltransferase domain-containing protein [Candidatus Dormibacteraeota bacterium]
MKAIRKLARSVRKRAGWLVGPPPDPREFLRRETIAGAYLRGDGIEIGALHHPTNAGPWARVKYVDRMAEAELRRQYPELDSEKLVRVDIIDDGESLRTIRDGTQDFVIANHFVEHCEDPIGAVGNMLRVLKDGGVLFMAIPDKRFTFDRDRPVTPLDHLLRDHEESPAWSRRQHYEEWARLVNGVRDDAGLQREVERLMATRYAIHYHVWTQLELLEFILALRKKWSFEVELVLKRKNEVIFILKRQPGS